MTARLFGIQDDQAEVVVNWFLGKYLFHPCKFIKVKVHGINQAYGTFYFFL